MLSVVQKELYQLQCVKCLTVIYMVPLSSCFKTYFNCASGWGMREAFKLFLSTHFTTANHHSQTVLYLLEKIILSLNYVLAQGHHQPTSSSSFLK